MSEYKTYEVEHFATGFKVGEIAAMLPHYKAAKKESEPVLMRRFYETGQLKGRIDTKGMFENTPLSQRQGRQALYDVQSNIVSWSERAYIAFKKHVTKSSLSEADKKILYTINANKAWFIVNPELKIDGETGEYLKEKQPLNHPDLMHLARHIFKHVSRNMEPRGDYSRSNTMMLSGDVVKRQEPKHATQAGRVNYWLGVSVLGRGILLMFRSQSLSML